MGNPLKYAYILETSTCIDLASNALTDAIPTGIGNLGGLNYLYLPKYGLPGFILSTIGNPLQLSGTNRFVDKWHDSIRFGKLVIPQLF